MWTYGPATNLPRFPSRFHSSNGPRLLGSTGYTWSSFGTDDGDTLRWWCTWKMGRFKTTSNVRISGRDGDMEILLDGIQKSHRNTIEQKSVLPLPPVLLVAQFVHLWRKGVIYLKKINASFKLGCDVNLPHFQGGKWRFRFRWMFPKIGVPPNHPF